MVITTTHLIASQPRASLPVPEGADSVPALRRDLFSDKNLLQQLATVAGHTDRSE
jgi:hypothetical protein